MATTAQWIAGARPRTLPVAVSPVVVGTAAAAPLSSANLAYALLALIVSLSLQVGVNYANDYSDGIRGTDDAARIGPLRLVGQGLARPENVRFAAFSFFGLAALAGLALVALSGSLLLLLIGALAILAAWRYTGGSNPYGYRGLGEVYVFVFFGLVATLGTLWTQAHDVTWAGLLGATGVGCLASAVLVANNLRDVPSDTAAGKRTLAVRLGDRRTRWLYVALVAVAFVAAAATAVMYPWALLALPAAGVFVAPVRATLSGASGLRLVPVLAATGIGQLAYAVLLAVGLVIG